MDKIKNICEKNKYTMCIFIGMLIFTTVICTNFIKTHFALDTYCVYLYDSQELISHFLLSNRIVSALARWIFDVLRIPLLVNMKILSIIGILFLATAWFILYKFIIRISNKQNNIFYNILIIGISFIIIYNFCSVECLAFWESGIICFGILCTVIAACLFNSNIKYNKLITFIFVLLASICYQGAITLFIPLALVFLAYKNKEINKENIKRIVVESIKVGIIYIIVMVINLVATKIFSTVFNYEFRKIGALSIAEILHTIARLGTDMVIKTFGILPKFIYALIISIISVIILLYIFRKKKSKFYILEYIILIASCILIPILPMLATPIESQYMESRMAISFGASIGIALLFFILVLEVYKFKCYKICSIIIICGMIMLNSMYYIIASSEMIATNYLDRNIAQEINNEINKYETKTGIHIENIGLTFDKNITVNYDGQRWLGVINTRSMATEWAAIETIELYSGKYYNQVEVPTKYQEEFAQKDWNYFDKEQLFFEENNLYICMY